MMHKHLSIIRSYTNIKNFKIDVSVDIYDHHQNYVDTLKEQFDYLKTRGFAGLVNNPVQEDEFYSFRF